MQPSIFFSILVFVLHATALADYESILGHESWECINRARLTLLFFDVNPKSFSPPIKYGESCTERVRSEIKVGNLHSINPTGIIGALGHGYEFGPPTTPNEMACQLRVVPEARCVQGVTSKFDASKWAVKISAMKKKRVLSVGEGDAGLVEYLLKKDVDAYGLDLTYKKKTGRYVFGDATTLSAHPLIGQKKADYILSAALMCELPFELNVAFLVGGVAALSENGEFRSEYFVHKADYGSDPEKILTEAKSKLDKLGIKAEYQLLKLKRKFDSFTDEEALFIAIYIRRVSENESPPPVVQDCSLPQNL